MADGLSYDGRFGVVFPWSGVANDLIGERKGIQEGAKVTVPYYLYNGTQASAADGLSYDGRFGVVFPWSGVANDLIGERKGSQLGVVFPRFSLKE